MSMPENILGRFFEHHVWANLQIVQACAALTEEQLEAQPHSATKGTIRQTLMHLAEAERGYLGDLTGERDWGEFKGPPTLEELKESLAATGEGLLTLAREGSSQRMNEDVHSEDGYIIAPWLLMLQALNHATEHREQIKSMLTALGLKPPRIDGWIYGRTQNAFIAPEKKG